jgi:glycosyltransferase involved in cell wall biosynthesis
MRILFVSFSDFRGGAAIAASSLFKLIKSKKKKFLTAEKKKKFSFQIFNFLGFYKITVLRIIEKILIFLILKKKFHQSLNIFNTKVYEKINSYKSTIINLHWINRSMMSLNDILKIKGKILISMHDMWFLNSTEHYSIKFKVGEDFISKYCWKKKKKIFKQKNIFFLVHNEWMLNNLKKKFPKLKKKFFLCKYYPINTKIFKPRNKNFLRKKYNLPLDKKIILFSAQDNSDYRKGYFYFKKIIKSFKNNEDFYFLSVGKKNNEQFKYENYKHINFLPLNKIPDIYSLSDIFLCTSIVDNLPLTILEALSSGNIVISLNNGGAKEVVNKTGYVYDFDEIDKLIKQIKQININLIRKKSKISRSFALKNFNETIISSRYKKILKQIQSYPI